MRGAPEMSPALDDVLQALDGASVNGVISREHLATVRGFLEQLNEVRDCPAVVLDQDQAAALEGAYLAGFKCADESGHVLVVSLPALLAYVGRPAPAARLSWRVRVGQLLARLFGPSASACTQDCNQGRACTCQPLRTVPPALVQHCTWPECVCSFERMVAGCQTHRKNLTGENQHAG